MTSSNPPRPGNAVGEDYPATLPDVLQFMRLLWAVVNGLDTTSKRMTRRIGVTGSQRLVLCLFGLFPGMSAGDLAAILHVYPSTLTGVLRRLTAQRLLARADDPHDRRRAIVRLTAHGARANAIGPATVVSAIGEALAGLSPRDRAAAHKVLARLADHLAPSAEWHRARRCRPRRRTVRHGKEPPRA